MLHHRLGPDAGAPGATLALGAALEGAGCTVEYFGFEHAFREPSPEGVAKRLRFPWRAASFLRRDARRFDIIDASTGDAWAWATLRRPGAGTPQALVTRAHGLEHVSHEGLRRAAREAGTGLGWRYPIYHGGLRLWEVRRSLVLADHCVMLNSIDRDWARDRLGVADDRLSVMPNAIAAHFADAPEVSGPGDGPIRLAFVGNWIARKGKDVVAQVLERLLAEGTAFELTVLGVGEGAPVTEELPAAAREHTTVIPRFRNEELPGLLAEQEVLLFPSRSEGSSVALIEAMACGLAPVATRVGANADVIEDGQSGFVVDVGDAAAIAAVIRSMAEDRERLERLRRAAQARARGYRWDRVAEETVRLYERVLSS